MNLFQRKKKTNRFLELLTQQAGLTVEGMEVLRRYVRKPHVELAEKLRHIEKEADEVRRILIDELNRTFVTPFDREDIFALSLTVDDVLDYAYTTVDEMEIFDAEPNDYIRRMVDLLADAATEVLRGIERLDGHPKCSQRARSTGQSSGKPRRRSVSRSPGRSFRGS